MKDSIDYINIEPKETVLKALGLAIESGLASALTQMTADPACTTLSRIEKTSLQSVVKASPAGITALEVCYHTGLTGNALLLMRTEDMSRLGTQVSGVDAMVGDGIAPEAVDACVQFFSDAMQSANAAFTKEHRVPVESDPLRVVSVNGGPGLNSLFSSYEGSPCLTFQVLVDSQIDARVQLLVHSELLSGLMDLLPDYDSGSNLKVADRPGCLGEALDPEIPQSDAGRAINTKPSSNWNIDLLLDIEMPIVVSFGEAEMQLKDVLKLGAGSVIELDKSVNDPVTVVVNSKAIARGEVVMVDGNYGVRIVEVESTSERIRSLG